MRAGYVLAAGFFVVLFSAGSLHARSACHHFNQSHPTCRAQDSLRFQPLTELREIEVIAPILPDDGRQEVHSLYTSRLSGEAQQLIHLFSALTLSHLDLKRETPPVNGKDTIFIPFVYDMKYEFAQGFEPLNWVSDKLNIQSLRDVHLLQGLLTVTAYAEVDHAGKVRNIDFIEYGDGRMLELLLRMSLFRRDEFTYDPVTRARRTPHDGLTRFLQMTNEPILKQYFEMNWPEIRATLEKSLKGET